jgi:two-component system, OmpR family, sensor kinase
VLRAPRRIRTRLTLAFVAVLSLVLGVAGLVVYRQFTNGLVGNVDQELAQRRPDLIDLAFDRDNPRQIVEESGERLVQLFRPDGVLVATSRRLRGVRLLTAARVRAVPRRGLSVTTDDAREDDNVRVLAFPIARHDLVAVIGESLRLSHRDQRQLIELLALVLPIALVLAGYAGYLVAGAALRPVDQMRRRAAAITEADLTQRLPVPSTDDEIERLGTTLNELLARLDATLARERRLVSDASHELRTPLTILRAELAVAVDGPADPREQRRTLESALEEVDRLSRLTDDLLVLARLDEGALPLRTEPLDVQELLDVTVGRHRRAADRAGRSLHATVAIAGGAVVLADADRTAQVLDNLVANALAHGAGAVDLRAESDGGGRVAISVRDHGPGYPDGFVAHAFERFSQADGARSGPHSGLGLAIVAAVTEAQDGRAEVANHPRGGAVATITLPTA